MRHSASERRLIGSTDRRYPLRTPAVGSLPEKRITLRLTVLIVGSGACICREIKCVGDGTTAVKELFLVADTCRICESQPVEHPPHHFPKRLIMGILTLCLLLPPTNASSSRFSTT